MYSEIACAERDKAIEEIRAATTRTIAEANQATFDQALTIAWQKGWQSCMDAHELSGTVIKDDEQEET